MQLQGLIKSLLDVDANKRPSAADVKGIAQRMVDTIIQQQQLQWQQQQQQQQLAPSGATSRSVQQPQHGSSSMLSPAGQATGRLPPVLTPGGGLAANRLPRLQEYKIPLSSLERVDIASASSAPGTAAPPGALPRLPITPSGRSLPPLQQQPLPQLYPGEDTVYVQAMLMNR